MLLSTGALFGATSGGVDGDDSVLAYKGFAVDVSNSSTYTFSNFPIGIANANRTIVVEILCDDSGTPSISSVTIGGITAKSHGLGAQSSTGGIFRFSAIVPTGTTADIVVTFSATSPTRCGIWVWRTLVANLCQIAFSPLAVSGSSPRTLSNIPVRSGGFFIASIYNSSSIAGITWNGADSIVSDYGPGQPFNVAPDNATVAFSATSFKSTESVDTGDLQDTYTGTQAIRMLAASYVGSAYAPYTPVAASTLNDATSQTTYTFNGKSTGTAHAARYTIVAFAWDSASVRTITSVTVDGNAATAVIAPGAAAVGGVAIYMIANPTGTSSNVVITMSGACTRMTGVVYDARLRGLAAAIDSVSNAATATSVTGADDQVFDNGFIIVAGCSAAAETLTGSYNGVDTLTKDLEAQSGSRTHGYWSCLTTESSPSNDPGFSSGASNAKRMCAASFI